MEQFFIYKDTQHKIKLKFTGYKGGIRPMYVPVGGLNHYSKEWFKVYGHDQKPSVYWTGLIPFGPVKHSFIAKKPCNKPGDRVK